MLNRAIAVFMLTAMLVACGGGGGSAGSSGSGAGTGGTGSTSTSVVSPASVEVLVSGNQIPSAGGSLNITAIVKSASNVGLSDRTVTFSATSGVLVVASSGLTDASGVATASISAGADKSNRDITITVTSGSASGSIVVPVTGTKLQISGVGTLQAGSPASSYVVKLVDSSGLPISGKTLTLSSSLGNPIAGSAVTDFNGQATYLYTANTAGNDVVTAVGLGAQAQTTIAVSNVDFTALLPSANTLVSVNTSQTVTVRYRVAGVGQTGRTVTFSTTRGTLSSNTAMTNGSGEATVSISASSAGSASVVAQIDGVGQVILPLQFVAVAPSTLVLQANPGAVAPNLAGSSSNQIALEALVSDANGNPVANRLVNFSLLTGSGGGYIAAPGYATTDTNGKASIQFVSGAASTPSNGVVVQAQVASTAVSGTTALTVNNQALFISIGFGNTISNQDETTYKKQFSVYVTDANGAAVGNKEVTIRAIPTEYGKGTLSFSVNQWRYFSYTGCPNEDTDSSGIYSIQKDTNGNGTLQPGNPVVASPALLRTDSSGFATFNLIYGEQYALWLTVNLEARATVSGTESKTVLSHELKALASDLTNENAVPAGQTSPFGVAASCTDPN